MLTIRLITQPGLDWWVFCSAHRRNLYETLKLETTALILSLNPSLNDQPKQRLSVKTSEVEIRVEIRREPSSNNYGWSSQLTKLSWKTKLAHFSPANWIVTCNLQLWINILIWIDWIDFSLVVRSWYPSFAISNYLAFNRIHSFEKIKQKF